ncbi:MAG: glycoside hydrolase family 15 protein [Proteobacteria bacterium]|nr:glycoside hydrolase family 15 protein [Pseudomonadota bacterium]
MRLEDLGIIGNCQFSALVENTGSIVWCCLPRFDSEPVFATLLDAGDGGQFQIGPVDHAPGSQRYLDNTNIIETTFDTADGGVRLLDFVPRFTQYDRAFRPTQIIRIVEPVHGTPRIRVTCEPVLGWSKVKPGRVHGSNHLRFEGFPAQLRLTTDLPISYLGGQPFALTERRYFVLTWGMPVEEPLAPLCERFLQETTRYWRRWVKECDVPPVFQQEVIRSALTLKLHCFEDTGAIVAATTTSIPEAPGSGRTWDYRYCWLRDAYYALSAFRLLGHFEEREQFVRYLINVATASPDLELAPLYRIDATTDLDESILSSWPGYNGEGPVRIGNGAAKQRQLDVFGEMVLALCPVFMDDRFSGERSYETLDLLQRLARKAISVVGTPDTGIWEHRNGTHPQTFSSLMCWAAADRTAAILGRRGIDGAGELKQAAARILGEINASAWNEAKGAFVATYGGAGLDASLLQMATLRLLKADDPRLRATIEAIWRELAHGDWLLRYNVDDGFGVPTVAFIMCTFWLVEALVVVGKTREARALLERARGALSPLGLLSEDYEVKGLRMWGNFPQAYSHVGLIHAAFAASPRWSEVL